MLQTFLDKKYIEIEYDKVLVLQNLNHFINTWHLRMALGRPDSQVNLSLFVSSLCFDVCPKLQGDPPASLSFQTPMKITNGLIS